MSKQEVLRVNSSAPRTEKRQTGGNTDQRYPNIGWLFYKDYYNGLQQSWLVEHLPTMPSPPEDYYNGLQQSWLVENPDKETKKHTEEYFKDKNTLLCKAPYSLTNASSVFKEISNTCFELFTSYPGLIIGSGSSHETGLTGEIKLGFQFDYTTGLPYIPASSVKGMLRSMFPYSLKVRSKADELEEEVTYREQRIKYISAICGELKDDTGKPFTFDDGSKLNLTNEEVKNLELSIFEGVDRVDKSLTIQNRDLFFDALVVETKEKLLGLDFITPHKDPVKSSNKKRENKTIYNFITPHKDPVKSPNPIQFLKVLPGVKFRFSFRLRNTELGKNRCFTEKMKKMLFKRILEDIGLGAKTNVGYGQFRR